MIVTNGTQFAQPWVDKGGQKTGTLAAVFGGLYWRKESATKAAYQATKCGRTFDQSAVRIYPPPGRRAVL